MKKIQILHIIPNFGPGGAERLAVHLMQSLNRERFEVAAVSMFDRVGCDLEAMLERSGIPVWYLGKRRGFDPRMYSRIDAVFSTSDSARPSEWEYTSCVSWTGCASRWLPLGCSVLGIQSSSRCLLVCLSSFSS